MTVLRLLLGAAVACFAAGAALGQVPSGAGKPGGAAQLDGNGNLPLAGTVTPLDLKVNGTDGVAGAWANQGLTATPAAGAYTTSAAALHSKKFGTTVHYTLIWYLTSVGTGTGAATLGTLPYTQDPNTYCILAGQEVSSGKAVIFRVGYNSATITAVYSDGTAFASGATFVASGTCQTAS